MLNLGSTGTEKMKTFITCIFYYIVTVIPQAKKLFAASTRISYALFYPSNTRVSMRPKFFTWKSIPPQYFKAHKPFSFWDIGNAMEV